MLKTVPEVGGRISLAGIVLVAHSAIKAVIQTAECLSEKDRRKKSALSGRCVRSGI